MISKKASTSFLLVVMQSRNIPAWLFCDHHHRDAIAYRILGLPESLMVSRRWFYLIPAHGEPVKLLHRIEPHHLDALPGRMRVYAQWQELVTNLGEMLSGVCWHGRFDSQPRSQRGQFREPGGAVRSLDGTTDSACILLLAIP